MRRWSCRGRGRRGPPGPDRHVHRPGLRHLAAGRPRPAAGGRAAGDDPARRPRRREHLPRPRHAGLSPGLERRGCCRWSGAGLREQRPALRHLHAGASGAVEVDEFTADGDSVALSSGRRVLSVPHSGLYENGGQLEFGPDGLLYVTIGDNGQPGTAQSLDSLLGKILRIDPRASGSAPYTVPADNPFAGSPIWAYGTAQPVATSPSTGSRATMLDRRRGPFAPGGDRHFARRRPPGGVEPRLGLPGGDDRLPYAPSSCGTCSGSYAEPISTTPTRRTGLLPRSPAATWSATEPRRPLRPLPVRRHVRRRDPFAGSGRAGHHSPLGGPEGRPTRRASARTPAGASTSPRSHGDEVCRFEGEAPPSCLAAGPVPQSARCAGRPATRVAGAGRSILGSTPTT